MAHDSVDVSLRKFNGKRVLRLRKQDLGDLARSIVAVMHRRAKVAVLRMHDSDVVHLTGPDTNMHVLGSDWEKILPYLENDTLNPMLTVPGIAGSSSGTSMENYVLHLLETLFPDSWPT